MPNGLSNYLKGHTVIGLDLGVSAKLTVVWTILNKVLLRSRLNLGFSLNYFSFLLVFVLFCAFRTILLYMPCFKKLFLSENEYTEHAQ